ncbi:MAG TPA: dihydrofolate reductase family protein [Ktedonobacteraceae bacterium]|jgi:dihydrofolate reductase|nr:dihydrofolate reductase family protein [Ktedonobacteraceae bacterium]
MRKLVVTEYLTLDGVFEEPGKWSFEYWGEEAMLYKRDELFSSDVQLLGRVTYEGFARAWPAMPDTGDFGERMNSMPKYVVSTTLTHADWQNSTIISKNIVEEIQKLKEQQGQNILVAGSGQLVRTLLQHHLVDEFRCMLYPVVLGSGKRLFPEGTEMFKLQFLETRAFKTGIVVLHYQPERS